MNYAIVLNELLECTCEYFHPWVDRQFVSQGICMQHKNPQRQQASSIYPAEFRIRKDNCDLPVMSVTNIGSPGQ